MTPRSCASTRSSPRRAHERGRGWGRPQRGPRKLRRACVVPWRRLPRAAALTSAARCGLPPSRLCAQVKNIEVIQLGQHEMHTWYFSPFPPEYKDCTKLYFCEYRWGQAPIV